MSAVRQEFVFRFLSQTEHNSVILKVCRYPVETLKSNVELSEFMYEYHYTLFKSFCKGYLEKEKKKIIPSYPNNKKSV